MRYPLLDMEGLTTVVALAEKRDYVKAGELLHIGPSAVLKRLAKAENELQTRLFQKAGDSVVLTSDGQLFAAEAQRSLSYAVLAEEKVRAAKSLRDRRLLVRHSTHLPARLLVLLAHLQSEDISGMTVVQTSGLDDEIQTAVENSLQHVGFCYLPANQLHLSALPLIEEPVVLCIPPRHPLATKSEIRPEDLERQPVITTGKQILPALFEEIYQFYRGFGVELEVVTDAFAVSEALCLVEQHIGVCFLSRSLAALNRNIVVKPLSSSLLSCQCGLIVHRENRHPLVNNFVSLVTEKMKLARL